ncbi:hypothetical protein B0T14DRAFT_86861 [Immersiella caudata]|uniref:Azaphilone pigments biosynthesis cluster protein L N-terminal domain-containing protein n=1 Tax=Immersiella caudata TaxID=314043 RepID=A0AA40CE60_9PEZI|nr:hypothetical protein B0T14DRAFT_86861 [Immersiella caudata]
MDPLSVAASVFGLLTAGAKITSVLFNFAGSVSNASSVVASLVRKMNDIEAALCSLQAYINGSTQPSTDRGALIQLEHVLTTLTGCVTTHSELQCIVDDLDTSADMNTMGKLKWTRHEGTINLILQRLQSHKLSLTLMLTILQCQNLQEAQNSNRNLCVLMEQVLASNKDLAARIRGLERDGSILSQSAQDNASTIQPAGQQRPSTSIDMGISAPRFTFDEDLEASRAHNRAVNRHSMSSFASTALYTTALSVFSKLSLSQVSNISFFALPVYLDDLANKQFYIFGDEGVLQIPEDDKLTVEKASAPSLKATGSDHDTTPTSSPANTHSPLAPSRLLGRFARRRKPVISGPQDAVHVTHLRYDFSRKGLVGV